MYILFKKGNTCNNKVFKEECMKKDIHLKNIGERNINDKMISYVVIGVIIVAIIIISLLLYSQKINNDVKDETITLDQMTDMMGDTDEYNEETESASTEIGKTVEESKEEIEQENVVQNQTVQNISNNESIENSSISTNTTQNSTSEEQQETQEVKELSFERPVEGEFVREFAQENLVYSETLEESGVDSESPELDSSLTTELPDSPLVELSPPLAQETRLKDITAAKATTKIFFIFINPFYTVKYSSQSTQTI